MPSLLFVVLSAGFIVLAVVTSICAAKAQKPIWEFFFCLCVMSVLGAIVTAGLTFSSMKRVPEDHIRVLSRSGEIFRVLDSGQHFVWEIVPYNSHNISRRWRSSSFLPAEGETRDGLQEPLTAETENGKKYKVNLTVEWRLKSDGEYVNMAWHAVRRHARENDTPGAKLEDRLWHKETASIVKETLESCLENHSIAKAKESGVYEAIERCVENRFYSQNKRRYDHDDTSFYEIRNVRNITAFPS